MKRSEQPWSLIRARLAVVAGFFILLATAVAVQAQTFTVIHNFTNGGDGASPGELTIDGAGNLYGAAAQGGYQGGDCVPFGCGVVFRMTHVGSRWTLASLYTFQSLIDGASPGPVIFGPDGALYGATQGGGLCQGGPSGCGTVYKLAPPPFFCRTTLCPWTKTVLYDFAGNNDGQTPVGPVTFGPDGSLYGVTDRGGAYNYGTVYKLAPSNGGWVESVLHTFQYGDGINPTDGVVLDRAGNLYGVGSYGGANGVGTVYESSPSGSGWTFSVLHDFTYANDGAYPLGGLILDQSGNIYGTTNGGGLAHPPGGVVFSLSPSNGSWTESLLWSFNGIDDGGPAARLHMDANGDLYGTTVADGFYGYGSAFELVPTSNGWDLTDLHDFGWIDGAYPGSNLVWDSQGNIYGTASMGGAYGYGVVFEITP